MAERKGGIPPIVTVLITISAIVAASLVAWFLYASTRSATQTPLLDVTEADVVGTTLYVTVKNLSPFNITKIANFTPKYVVCASGASSKANPTVTPTSIAPGTSFVVSVQMSSAPSDGDSCTMSLQVTASNGNTYAVNLGFKVTKP